MKGVQQVTAYDVKHVHVESRVPESDLVNVVAI